MLLMQLRMLVIVPKYHCSVPALRFTVIICPRDPHPCSVVILDTADVGLIIMSYIYTMELKTVKRRAGTLQ
jgi:hypothetical protein